MKYTGKSFILLVLLLGCSNTSNLKDATELNNIAMRTIFQNNDNIDSVNKALKILDSAIMLDSTYLLAQINKLNTLKDYKRYNEALDFYNRIVPRFGVSLKSMEGELKWKLGDSLEAKNIFINILMRNQLIDKSDENFYYLLCYAYGYQVAVDSLHYYSDKKIVDKIKYEGILSLIQNIEENKR